MSSNNTPRNTDSNNQSSQGSKSPSQESIKPVSNTPETANNQQKGQNPDAGMEKGANPQHKQGGMENEGNGGKVRPLDDDRQPEQSDRANATKGTGTR
jgi:hypothetical protein